MDQQNEEMAPEAGGIINIDETVSNLALADAVEPVRTPSGDFDLQVTGWKTGESSQKKTPFIQFGFSITGTRAIADGQQLEDNFNEDDLMGRPLTYDFYLTTKAVFMLKNFLDTLGFDMGTRTVGDLLTNRAFDEVIGAAVVGLIRPEHYTTKTGEAKIAHRLSDFAKV